MMLNINSCDHSCMKQNFLSPVDGVWYNWAEWSECSVTCGGGTTRRTRECEPPQYNGVDCMGSSEEEVACNENACPSE